MSKRNGAHPDKALSAVKVRGIKLPGRYADGNGLYLIVDQSGSKRWMLRTVIRGRRRDIGLGGLRTVSLAEAREEASRLRRIARSGGDPLEQRRREKRAVPTFEEAARRVHAEHSPSWKNAKHSAQWLSTLEDYVFPTMGRERVDYVEAPHILKALSPIWLSRPETARRIRQRIGVILDWAKTAGFRQTQNPINGIEKGLPKQTDRTRHHKAMPYDEVPAFIKKLQGIDASESIRLAFEFLILTATRTSEVIQATWDEIDETGKIWVIPVERMKARREHRVPLSARCRDILANARKLSDGKGYIFPGRSSDRPLSNMAFLMTLRRMNVAVTAHGFRSTFRDWAAERTNYPREVCEQALAHSLHDKTEAAYRRGDLFEKRKQLMAAWSSFATSTPADIVKLHTNKKPRNVSA